MLRYIIAVIAATSSDPDRYFAKGSAPLNERARQSGHSTSNAINTDQRAGVVMTVGKISIIKANFGSIREADTLYPPMMLWERCLASDCPPGTVSNKCARGRLQRLNGNHDETPAGCIKHAPCCNVRLTHRDNTVNLI